MEPRLRVENLRVEYPSFCLKDVSFALQPGEIVGMAGENGAGKSTVIKAILGIAACSGGRIFFDGSQIFERDFAKLRQQTGYVGDAELYYAKLKADRLLSFLGDIYEDWDRALMEKYLKEFRIDTEKKMLELSMGMRVKLEIAVALSHHASLYLLDEPTSGLDPMVRSQILKILKKLGKEEGKTILFSSHITSDLDKIADRVLYMSEGRLLMDKRLSDIRREYLKIPMYSQLTFAEAGEYGGVIVEDGIVFPRDLLDDDFFRKNGDRELKVTTEDMLFLVNKGGCR